MSGQLFQPAACFPCVCSQRKHGQHPSSISAALPDHHGSQAGPQSSADSWVFKQILTNLTYCSNQHMATIWIKCNTTDFTDGCSLPCGTTPSQPGTIHKQRRTILCQVPLNIWPGKIQGKRAGSPDLLLWMSMLLHTDTSNPALQALLQDTNTDLDGEETKRKACCKNPRLASAI